MNLTGQGVYYINQGVICLVGAFVSWLFALLFVNLIYKFIKKLKE